jgi:hypothetical protein
VFTSPTIAVEGAMLAESSPNTSAPRTPTRSWTAWWPAGCDGLLKLRQFALTLPPCGHLGMWPYEGRAAIDAYIQIVVARRLIVDSVTCSDSCQRLQSCFCVSSHSPQSVTRHLPMSSPARDVFKQLLRPVTSKSRTLEWSGVSALELLPFCLQHHQTGNAVGRGNI